MKGLGGGPPSETAGSPRTGRRAEGRHRLTDPGRPFQQECAFPFYRWGNRGSGSMMGFLNNHTVTTENPGCPMRGAVTSPEVSTGHGAHPTPLDFLTPLPLQGLAAQCHPMCRQLDVVPCRKLVHQVELRVPQPGLHSQLAGRVVGSGGLRSLCI